MAKHSAHPTAHTTQSFAEAKVINTKFCFTFFSGITILIVPQVYIHSLEYIMTLRFTMSSTDQTKAQCL